jgi:hypothetical protein
MAAIRSFVNFSVDSQAMPDGLEKMGLAEPHTPVDEQGVVGDGGRLGDRETGGLGELVGRADHEGLETVTGIEVRRVRRGRRGGRRGWDRAVDREDDMGPGPGHDGSRNAKGIEVVLLEILAEKLIRDAKFHAGIPRLKDAQGPDPGFQNLRGELPV